MMNKHYILDKDHNLVESDLETWAYNFEKKNRIVKQEYIGKIWVSTVFLGLDHQYGPGPPLLFETMMRNPDGSWNDYQERCSTWKQAKEMHEEGVIYAYNYQKFSQKLKRFITRIFNTKLW